MFAQKKLLAKNDAPPLFYQQNKLQNLKKIILGLLWTLVFINTLLGQNPPGGCTYYYEPLTPYTVKVASSSDDAREDVASSGSMSTLDSYHKLGKEGTLPITRETATAHTKKPL